MDNAIGSAVLRGGFFVRFRASLRMKKDPRGRVLAIC